MHWRALTLVGACIGCGLVLNMQVLGSAPDDPVVSEVEAVALDTVVDTSPTMTSTAPTTTSTSPTTTSTSPTTMSTAPTTTSTAPITTSTLPIAASSVTYPTYQMPGVADIVLAFADQATLTLWSVSAMTGWVYDVEHDGPNSVVVNFFNTQTNAEAEFQAELEDTGIQVEYDS